MTESSEKTIIAPPERGKYTLFDISSALFQAREEIIPKFKPKPEGSIRTSSYGDVEEIRWLVRNAQMKAKKESKGMWLFGRRKGLGGEIRYDAEHAVGILDALVELSQGKTSENYANIGIIPSVIRRTEEILLQVKVVKQPSSERTVSTSKA